MPLVNLFSSLPLYQMLLSSINNVSEGDLCIKTQKFVAYYSAADIFKYNESVETNK
jgi:hypothetical protein